MLSEGFALPSDGSGDSSDDSSAMLDESQPSSGTLSSQVCCNLVSNVVILCVVCAVM